MIRFLNSPFGANISSLVFWMPLFKLKIHSKILRDYIFANF